MTVLIVILCVCVLALLVRVYILGEKLAEKVIQDNLNWKMMESRLSSHGSDCYVASRAADSARRSAENINYETRRLCASKDDLAALADALGFEWFIEPAQDGWRKKAK